MEYKTEGARTDGPTAKDPELVVARAIWLAEFKSVHPDATTDEIKRQWGQARIEYQRIARRVMTALQRNGFAVGRAVR